MISVFKNKSMFSFQTRKEHKENCPHTRWGVDSINVFDRSNFFRFYNLITPKSTTSYTPKVQPIITKSYNLITPKSTTSYNLKVQPSTTQKYNLITPKSTTKYNPKVQPYHTQKYNQVQPFKIVSETF